MGGRLSRIVWLLLLLLVTGCGRTVAAGGERTKPRTPVSVDELIPADLDLVVRIDLARARASLGPDISQDLLTEAADRTRADASIRAALAEAEVAWLATRVADAEAGDRVFAVRLERRRRVEGEEAAKPRLTPDNIAWKKLEGEAGVLRYGTRRERLDRGQTERVYLLDDKAAIFATPVEVPAVDRVLADGPDAARGRPEARGLFSLDYRASRLSPEMVRAFPNLAKLWRGIRSMSAVVDDRGDGLELEGRIRCESPRAAEDILRFLTAIKEGSADTDYGPLMAELELSRTASSVAVRWPWQRGILRELLLRRRNGAGGAAPEPVPPEPVPSP